MKREATMVKVRFNDDFKRDAEGVVTPTSVTNRQQTGNWTCPDLVERHSLCDGHCGFVSDVGAYGTN